MNDDTSPKSNVDSVEPSKPSVPLNTNATIGVRHLSESSLLDLRNNRKQSGIIDKIGTGIKTVIRRFSRTNTTLSPLEIQILSTITQFNCNEVLQW
jgi:hypothetical protein